MNLEQNYCFQVFGIFAEKLSSLYFCLVDHWVETVEIWTQVAAQLCKMRKKNPLKICKTNNKISLLSNERYSILYCFQI